MRLISTAVADQTTPHFDEGATVAYSGPCLAELLASGEMTALQGLDVDVDVDVEETVVFAGSAPWPTLAPPACYPDDTPSSTTIEPVTYTHAHPVVALPSQRPGASRFGVELWVAVISAIVGLIVQISLSSAAHAKLGAPRRAQAVAHQSVDEKTPLVSLTRAKATPAPKRHIRASMSATTATAAAEEQLIRAAQLERPF